MKLSEKGFFQVFVCKSENSECYLKGEPSSGPPFLIKIIKFFENNIQIEKTGWPNGNKIFNPNFSKIPYSLEEVDISKNELYKFENYQDYFLNYLPKDDEIEEHFEYWYNDLFPEKTIAGWEEYTDYTYNFDLINLKMSKEEKANFHYLIEDVMPRYEYSKYADLVEELRIRGDKLGGHPVWIQRGDNVGDCSLCNNSHGWGTKIGFFFQISSQEEENIPFVPELFGDAGTIYIYNCEKHKNAYFLAVECG